MKRFTSKIMAVALGAAALSPLQSCLKDSETTDYTLWRQQNIDFVTKAEALAEDGKKVYEKIVPSWATGEFVLMRWHNDRALTADNLVPLSNSLVDITYTFENIEGEHWGDSFSNKINGDSIYQSRPSDNITGMWAALTNMHVGDSVTMVIPATAGYGAGGRSPILPYSTLIYHVKLKAIKAYELPK